MCHKPIGHSRQSGFAIVAAVFLLVVLTSLGAFMVNIATVQHTTAMTDLQGERAYQAAHAGIEWGLYQVKNPENINPAAPGPYTSSQYACGGTPAAIAMPAGTTLSGFAVTVSCAYTDQTDAGDLIRVYQLISTARAGTPGGIDYVERQLTVTLDTCRKALNGESCL